MIDAYDRLLAETGIFFLRQVVENIAVSLFKFKYLNYLEKY